jgi:eukaryotic-like serine/threonine-protein kinase
MPKEASGNGGSRDLRIGKYQVVRHIATGGMGAVYKAVDTDLGREVALKVLQPELAARTSMLQRFRREAQLAAKLRHENIVSIYEIGEAGGTHYLALEFVDGIDLNEYISRKGKLDPEEAKFLLTQAVKALIQVHKHGLVHRDIKPSNFLITRKGNQALVKLTDLGLAREVDDEEFKVTRAGTTVGTVDYMAPEQARNSRAADIRSDIYSLGCTLFHMLVGKPPYAEGGLTERMYKHSAEDVPDVCKLNRKVSPGLAAVLRRMMEKKPENRYQTPDELLKDLDRLEQGGGVTQTEVLASLAREGRTRDERPAKKKRFRDDPDEEDEEDEAPAGSSVRRAKARPIPQAEASRETPKSPVTVKRYRRGEKRIIPASSEDLVGMAPWWPYAALVAGVLLIVVIASIVVMRQDRRKDGGWDYKPATGGSILTPGKQHSELENVVPAVPSSGPVEPTETAKKAEPEPPKVVQVKPKQQSKQPPPKEPSGGGSGTVKAYPRPPQQGERAREVRERFQAPWKSPELDTEARTVCRVGRLDRGGDGEFFPTLAAAFEKAEAGKVTVVEVHDSGPLFLHPVAAAGKSLILRPGPGYRPLIAWETPPGNGTPATTLLSVTGGNLTLQDLDFVLKCPDGGDVLTFVKVVDGDLLAWGCSFSVARPRRDGVTAFHVERTKDRSPKCRVAHCFLRGRDLAALDLRAPGAEVLFEDTLVVGGARPLLDVQGKGNPLTNVRAARSTFVGRQTFLRIRPAEPGERTPAVHFHGLDTLVARAGDDEGGRMLVLEDCVQTNMEWHPDACAYAGWQTLLSFAEGRVTSQQPEVWKDLWKLKDVEAISTPAWPESLPADPGEIRKEEFRPAAGSRVHHPALSGPEALGCDVARVPPGRESWLTLTFDSFIPQRFDMPSAGTPPAVPPDRVGPYGGEKLNANTKDVGAYLEQKQRTQGLAPVVVLHLVGAGRAYTSPIRVNGSSLVIYFDSARDNPNGLELLPPVGGTGDAEALIDVRNGSLEITNGRFALPNSRIASMPRHLIRVQGGELRLAACRLTGPLGSVPDDYRGLIHFVGSGKGESDRALEAAVADSVLASGRACASVEGTGARLRIHNSVLVSGGDALELRPGAPADKWRLLAALLPGWNDVWSREFRLPQRQRANGQVILERNTVAVRGALLRLGDAGDFLAPVAEPYFVLARSNVFLDPFADGTRAGGMLAAEGRALGRGLLVWQGDGNVFDKGLHFYVAAADRLPTKPQEFDAWVRAWGLAGEQSPVALDVTKAERKLDLNRPEPGQLAFLRAKLKSVNAGSDLARPSGKPSLKGTK